MQINDEQPFHIKRDKDGFATEETLAGHLKREYEYNLDGLLTRQKLGTATCSGDMFPTEQIKMKSLQFLPVGKRGEVFLDRDMGETVHRSTPAQCLPGSRNVASAF